MFSCSLSNFLLSLSLSLSLLSLCVCFDALSLRIPPLAFVSRLTLSVAASFAFSDFALTDSALTLPPFSYSHVRTDIRSHTHTHTHTHTLPCFAPAGCTCVPGFGPDTARVAAVESGKCFELSDTPPDAGTAADNMRMDKRKDRNTRTHTHETQGQITHIVHGAILECRHNHTSTV